MRRSSMPLLVTAGVLVFFYLPLVLVVANSFNSARFGGAWAGFTLDWYRKLFNDRYLLDALKNTLIIAFGSTITSMVLGTAAAFALHRFQSTLQFTHNILIYTPLVVPDILMGISLLLFFVGLNIELGLFTIYLAHVTFCLSYVAMVVLARLQDFDFSVIEAAMDLGANQRTAVRKILLPMIAPGIVAGGLLAFTLSLDDFVITFFVSGPGSGTLPIYIYSMMKHGSPTVINALSVLFLVVTFFTVVLTKKLLKEKV